MIKVCFLISSLCNEGPVNVVYNILKYIDYAAIDISIITFIPEKENSQMDDFRKLPIHIWQLSPVKKIDPFRLLGRLQKTVDNIQPDILHAHCPRSLYLMPFLAKKYVKMYTIHNYPGELQRVLYGKLRGEIVIFLNHFFTRRIDCAVCCAPNIHMDYLKQKGWNFPCIPNGSSFPIWKQDKFQKNKLREQFGLKDDLKYFIFVGRFSPEKNPGKLIRVFKRLRDKSIGLILLGDGPLWGALKEEEDDRILLPGFQNNVYEYLIASDVYISASNGEGLANTLLESMSIGLPMLLSNIPSHEIVLSQMSQVTGFLFNQNSEDDLCDKIEQILKLNMENVASAIQTVFLEHYTAKRMSTSYQKLYYTLLNKKSFKNDEHTY